MLSKNLTKKIIHKPLKQQESEDEDDFYEWIEHSSILGRR